MNQIDCANVIVKTIKENMVESAVMTYNELGQKPDINVLFDDELKHLMDNIIYDIKTHYKGKIIRMVERKVNDYLNIDDSDERADDMIADCSACVNSE